jgi:hypothetical protein
MLKMFSEATNISLHQVTTGSCNKIVDFPLQELNDFLHDVHLY